MDGVIIINPVPKNYTSHNLKLLCISYGLMEKIAQGTKNS
jgi:hypothetical protein